MSGFAGGSAYAESDADDEYERSMHDLSPVGDLELSPIESDISGTTASTEHTPTYGRQGRGFSIDRLQETIITDWTADECADFIASIGLEQYCDCFIGEFFYFLRFGFYWPNLAYIFPA